ncbi:MAG: MFS transporter [Actinomycetota bacterium]
MTQIDARTDGHRFGAPAPLVVLVAGSLIATISLGVRSTFGLFQDPVIDELGLQRAPFALAIAIQAIVWGITQPIAGAVADRYGAGRVIVGGAVVYAIGIVVLAGADTEGGLLIYGFVTGIAAGSASFAVVLASVGRMAAPERRSMALGIITAMGSVGQFLLVPLARALLDRMDWRAVLVVFAAIAATMALLAPALRGNASDQQAADAGPTRSLGHDLRRAARSRSYLLLNAAFFVCGFHVTFIATHLPSYIGDLDITASAASSALALIGLFNVFGSLLAGWLGARIPHTYILASIYAARAVVIGVYLVVPTTATTTIVFGAVIGVLWLSTVPGTSAIVASLFGTANVGALFGIVFLSHQAGAFVGAWMGGVLADATGSYDAAWQTAIGLGIAAAILHLLIDERPEPDELPPRRGVAIAPAAGVVAVLLAGSLTITAARAEAHPQAVDRPAFVCAVS